LSNYEIYHCKNDKWSVHEYNYTNFSCTKGYILKTVEIEIRKTLGGKNSLNPPQINEIGIELRDGRRAWNQVKEWRKKAHDLLKDKEFGHAVANAVGAFCKTANIVVKDGTVTEVRPVEIDLRKLDRIREEHESTVKKLIIEEELEEVTTAPSQEEQDALLEQSEELSGFDGFVASLKDNEKGLLIAIIKSEQIPANNELLMESINEKALASVEDNIISYVDGIPSLYEEYEDELKIALGGKI
jgi:hypothetical protein